jgi:nuclear pore complex protein Nup107
VCSRRCNSWSLAKCSCDADSIATVADIMDQYKPELTAFARRLDESKLVVRSKSSKTAKNSRPGLKLIDEFRSYAAEQVEAATRTLSDLENMSPESRGDRYETNFRMARHEVRYWTLEHQTWELFEGLVTHRFETFPNDRAPGEFTDNKYISDICIRDYLYQHHSIFKELIIVLEWLQRHSLAPSIDEIEEEGLYRGDRGWMYTKERIKADKRLNTGKQLLHFGRMSNGFKAGTARYIVTELDPDAPSRQQRQLEQEDEGWERYLMRLVWAFLRKGQVKDAQDLCDDAGEYWRSATLGGSEIAWDPQIDGVREDGEERRVMGNRRRELWKRMCFAIARRKGGDEFEKAVYGTLCGDVESVSKELSFCIVAIANPDLGNTCM